MEPTVLEPKIFVAGALALALCQGLAFAQTPPSIALQPKDQSAPAGGTVTLRVTATGSGPFTYQWSHDGKTLPNNLIIPLAGSGLGDGRAATNVGFQSLGGAAAGPLGGVFMADIANQRVRRVDPTGIITTAAGNGLQGFSGDNGAATNASLDLPQSVAVDAAGNLFIADTQNQRIRKVDTNGVITTVAGISLKGRTGDGGAATNATLGSPSGVAVDSTGNILVADTGNAVIRRVDAAGIINTIAGNGVPGYSGDGGQATNASLNSPSGVCRDVFGNLFIADTGNAVVRKVEVNGIITTLAGNGSPGFSGEGGAATNASLGSPSGVSVDGLGNVFIADRGNQCVDKVDPRGIITLVAGNGSNGFSGDGGPATNAGLGYVSGVAAGPPGSFFIADAGNKRVRQVDAAGIITTIAGNGIGDGGPATNASLLYPSAMATTPAGDLLIADLQDRRVRKVDTNGIITTVAGGGTNSIGDGGGAVAVSLSGPSGLAIDGSGDLFIADTAGGRVRKVDTQGVISTVAGSGVEGYSGDGGLATNAALNFPSSVALDAAGNVTFLDLVNLRVRRVGGDGIVATVAGDGSVGYSGDGGAATNASLDSPSSVAIRGAGGLLIAGGSEAGSVRAVDANGIINRVAGDGAAGYSGDGGAALDASLGILRGMAVDATGNIFIADWGNGRIREVDYNGIITTVAGNGVGGYSGDGAAATNASLNGPTGVALDSSGDLYIADTGNRLVRKVARAGLPFLTLNHVTTADSGAYQVVVTGVAGSVTSSVATVTVSGAGQPEIIQLGSPLVAGNSLKIDFQVTGALSGGFTLLQSASLPGQWITNRVAILATNAAPGSYQFSVPVTGRMEYFQIRSP